MGSAITASPTAIGQPASDDATAFSRLFGGYALDEPSSRAEARIRTAIERGTEPVNAIMRGMARARLTENNPLIRRVRIAVRGRDVAVSTNGRTITAPASGAQRAVELDGRRVQASYGFAAGSLHQILDYGEATRRTTFELREDGRLLVTVTMASRILPNPLRYRLVLRRTR